MVEPPEHRACRTSEPTPVVHPGGYLSTACLHGQHEYCNSYTGAAGTKKPASCKFCGALCQCRQPGCHEWAVADSPQFTPSGQSASSGDVAACSG